MLELAKPICSYKSSSVPCNSDDDKDRMCTKVDHDVAETMDLEKLYAKEIKFEQEGMNELHGNIHEEHNIGSPDDNSNGCEHDHQTEDSFMLEGINGGASQVQSWHFVDDDFGNGVQGSMDSSDCISQAVWNKERIHTFPKDENVNTGQLKDFQECNGPKFSSLDLGVDDDLHYQRTISTILRKSHQLIGDSCFRRYDVKSSFVNWKKGGILDIYNPQMQQRILKKILFSVPLMYGSCNFSSQKENDGRDKICKSGSDGICKQHVLSDKRREKERFLVLRSMVPSLNKVIQLLNWKLFLACISYSIFNLPIFKFMQIDEVSILGDTIEYLKKLEARVEELESCMDLQTDMEVRARRKSLDMVEQTSDNYDDKTIDDGKRPWIYKRKACDIDNADSDINEIVPKEILPSSDMKVSINEHEVLIEMRCRWRDYLLLDIMDAVNNIHLDCHSVQSSNNEGFLNLVLKSKVSTGRFL